MKRWLSIGESFELEQTDDPEIKAQWVEFGYMIVDTQEGKSISYDPETGAEIEAEEIKEAELWVESPDE